MVKQPIECAYFADASLHKTIESIREMLAGAGLAVLGESHLRSCRILYVACPFLLLEALAFDRSTAVFVPAQVVVRRAPGGAEVHWINFASMPKLRLPAGAHRPVNTLYRRISQAFEALSSRK